MEGYTHQATLICLDIKSAVSDLIKKISEYLSIQSRLVYGITVAPVNGLIVRLLGQKAEQLYDCLKWTSLQILQSGNPKTNPKNTAAIVSL